MVKPKKVAIKVKIKVKIKPKKRAMKKRMPKGKAKISKVMHEYGAGDLHSGSKKGPVVKKPSQAIAIALSEQRKANK